MEIMSELYDIDKFPEVTFLIYIKLIDRYQP